jgi:hypothetical protein
MKTRFHDLRIPRIGLALALAASLALGLAWVAPPSAAGGGCGHDPRLDLADDSLENAFALIAAAQNPGVVPPFAGHDLLALRAIQRAREEVALAIAYAEQSCR